IAPAAITNIAADVRSGPVVRCRDRRRIGRRFDRQISRQGNPSGGNCRNNSNQSSRNKAHQHPHIFSAISHQITRHHKRLFDEAAEIAATVSIWLHRCPLWLESERKYPVPSLSGL